MASSWEELKKRKQGEKKAADVQGRSLPEKTHYTWEELKAKKNGNVSIAEADAEAASSSANGSVRYTWEQLKAKKAGLPLVPTEAQKSVKRGTYTSEVTTPYSEAAAAAYRKFKGEDAPASSLRVGAGEAAAEKVAGSFVGPLQKKYIREETQERQTTPLKPLEEYVAQKGKRIGAGEAALTDPQYIGYENLKTQPDYKQVISGPTRAVAPDGFLASRTGMSPGDYTLAMTAHMNDEEKNNFAYLANKYGPAEAEKYYASIEDELNRRQGTAAAQKSAEMPGWAREPYELFVAGASGFQGTLGGIRNAWNALTMQEKGEPIPASVYAAQNMAENNGFWGKLAMDLVQSAGQQIPQMMIAYATGGLSKVASTALTMAPFSASVLGNTYNQRLMEGYTPKDALKSSLASVVLETGLEIIGGPRALSGGILSDKAIDKIVDGIEVGVKRFAARTGFDMLGEGAEEFLSGALSPLIQNAILGEGAEEQDWGEIAYQTLVGTLSGGLLGTPENIATGVQENRTKAAQASAQSVKSKETTPEQKHNAAKKALEIADIENAEELADAVVKMANGEELTQDEMQAVATTEGALEVVKEIAGTEVNQKAADEQLEDVPEGLEGEELEAYENRRQAITTAAKLGGERRIHEEIYDMGGGRQKAGPYGMEYERAYNRGRNNMPLTDRVGKTYRTLTQEQVQAAWNAGRARTEELTQKKAVRTANSVSGRQGYIDTSAIKNVRLNENQRSAVNASRFIAETLGVKVAWYASETNDQGKRTSPNGWYDANDQSIHLDIYAGSNTAGNESMYRYAAMRTFAHELTHYIEDVSPAQYDQLRRMVFTHLGKNGYNVETLISEKQASGKGLSRFVATQEVVADACEMMLRDSTTMQTAAQQNPSLWEKIKERFAKFVEDLRNALKGVKATSKEALALMKEADGVLKYAEDLQKKWDEALLSTRQTQETAAETEQKADETERKASEAEQVTAEPEQEQTSSAREGITLMEERSWESIKDRSMRPFAEEVPEVREWFAMAAELLRDDLAASTPGQKMYIPVQGNEPGTVNVTGQKRSTVDEIADLLDHGMTYRNISDTLDAYAQIDMEWIRKHPQTAKKVELTLDQVLLHGYTNIEGERVPGVEDYKALMDELAGREAKEPVEYDLGEDMRFSARYDYTKPFAEQVEDWKARKIPERNALVIGEVPEVFKKIGLINLPMTITQRHVDYVLNGTKNDDHVFAESEFKNIPAKLKKPVAIIASRTQKATSLVAIIHAKTRSGKQGIAAVKIDGDAMLNGYQVDAQAVTTIHGRSNAIKLLHESIEAENKGETSLYFWDKKEAVALMVRSGLQLPGSVPQNGFVHSILEESSPVKPQFEDQAQTRQFKRWFGESRVVNSDGTPRVLYHQTNAEFTVFDTQKQGAGYNDSEMPSGIYMKETPDTIKLGTDFENSHQKPLYVRMEMPLYLLDREQANKYWQKHVPGYAQMQKELDELNARYEAEYDEADRLWEGDTDEDWDKWDAETSRVMEEWKTAENGKRRQMKEAINAWLKDSQYDGLIMMQDKGTGGTVKTYVVLKNTQVKSATENKGFFDPENEDIRYSLREPVADSAAFRKWFGESEIRNEDGSPKVMYHGTPYGGFTEFREWQYFTDNKEYADVYQSPSASSIRGRYNPATNPRTYEVYLRVEKPFDTRKPEIRRLWQKEFFGKWGDGTPLSERGLPDWTEGIDLIEWIEENEYNYDAIILDEGGTGGYGDEVHDRGVSVVVRSSYQVKSATDNTGAYSRESKDIRYQAREYDQISDRELLATATNSMARNAKERAMLDKYRNSVNEYLRKQTVAENMFHAMSKANISREAMITRQEQYQQILEEIDELDRELLEIEYDDDIQALIGRERSYIRERTDEARKRAVTEYRDRRNAAEARAVVRRIITGTVKRLHNRLEDPKPEHFVNDDMRKSIETLVKAFSPDGTFDKANLADVQSAYKNMFGDPDEIDATGFDDRTYENLGDLRNQLDGKKLTELTMDQLRMLRESIENIFHVIQHEETTFVQGRRENVAALASAVEAEAKEQGEYIERQGLEGARDFLNNGNATPIYFFKRIGGTLQRLFNEFLDGEAVYARDMQEAGDKINELKKKYNYEEWADKDDDRLTFVTSFGQEITLDRETALGLWATRQREMRDPENEVQHLKNGGFQYEEREWEKRKNKILDKIPLGKKRTGAKPAYRLADEDNNRIAAWLTPEQRGYATEMVEYLSTKMAEKGNEISRKLRGYSIFGEGFYYPYKSSSLYMSESLDKIESSMLKNSGFTKKITKNASNPIVAGRFTDVWADHVNRMSMYHAMAIPQDSFWRVYNNRTPSSKEDGYTSVKAAIIGAYGSGANKYIKQLMTDIYGGVASAYGDSIAGQMMSKFKRNAVAMSMSVVVQQPSAIARAFAMISPKYFVNTKGASRKRARAEMQKYSATAFVKGMGRFDMNAGRSATEWLLKRDLSDAKKMEKVKAFFSTKDSSVRDDAFGYLPQIMDEWTWAQIWNAAKAETAEKTKLAGEELLKATAKRFDEVIRETQVYDSVLVRSQFMRSKSAYAKMATAFMAEPTLSYNMMMDAARVAKTDKKAAGKIVAYVTAATVLNAVLKSFVSAYRDKDEDKTYVEKYIASLVSDLTGNVLNTKQGPASVIVGLLNSSLLPFNNIPLVQDAISIFQGYDVTRSDMNILVDAYTAYETAFNDNKTLYEKLYAAAKPASALTGWPISNVWRDAEGIVNLIVNDKRELLDTSARGIKYAVLAELGRKNTQSAETERMLDAAIKGDTETYERLRTHVSEDMDLTEKEITSAMKTRIRERYQDGGIDADEAAKLLEKYGDLADEKDDKYAAERLVREWDTREGSGNDSAYGNVWNYISDWDGKALKAEIKELKALGVEESSIRTSVTNHFKDEYLQATGREKTDLKAHLITALTMLGMSSAEAKKKIESWKEE